MTWVRGDHLGLDIPADAVALRKGGSVFLTEAFRAASALPADNAVQAVTALEEFRGGSTGRKALLSVRYDRPADLPTELFVKFSRDLDDPARDRGRTQMELEVRFALLSRGAGFPIAVPTCVFADYHRASGTGILITERIPYGANGIEPHYAKCLDYRMPDPLDHYRALLTALARLAGTHQGGHLPADLVDGFAVDMQQLSVGASTPYTAEQLRRRVDRLAEFAAAQPDLLPERLRAPAFLSRLREEVTRFPGHEQAIWRSLAVDADYIALCHWNANVDNAWFWRTETGLHCGLLDWGCVGQMHLAMALWGALCSAETQLWGQHLDTLLDHFVAEVAAGGGALLDPVVLRHDLVRYAAVMGLTWLLDVPSYLMRVLPARVSDRRDPQVADHETVRSRLLMMTNFLHLWERHDVVKLLDEAVGP